MKALLLTSFVFFIGINLMAQTKLEPGATKKITIKQEIPVVKKDINTNNQVQPEFSLNRQKVDNQLNWATANSGSKDSFFGKEDEIKELFIGGVIPIDFPVNQNYTSNVYQKMVVNWCHKNTDKLKKQYLIKNHLK